MNHPIVRAVFRREFHSSFGNPTTYVFIIFFVLLAAAALMLPATFFRSNLANLDTLNAWFPYLLLLFIPALTMSMWAGERANGTQELLFTLPAEDWQILLGKYLSAASVFTISLAFTLSLPIGLQLFLGGPDWGLVFCNYLGYWLLGLFLISVAMLGSQLTENLTLSFILGALACGLVIVSDWALSGIWPDLAQAWHRISPVGLFAEMGRGILSFTSILLFAGMTAAFLQLNLVLLSRRNWVRGAATGVHGGIRFAALVLGTAALAMIAVNRLPRVDTTFDRVHSLSAETTALLDELDPERPVYIQAFVSENVPQEFVQTRRSLLNLLDQYDAIGGSAVEVRVVTTERFTEEAREAEQNFGIHPRPMLTAEGESTRDYHLFLGLAFQCGTEEIIVPFVSRNLPVEYELTRSIRVAAAAQRRKVGVLKTDVDMFGGFDFQSMRQRPEWDIVAELKLQYQVENVDPDADYADDLDALVVPMVSSLVQEQMDRLRTYIAAGKPVLLIDDPFPASAPGMSATDPKGGQRNPFMGGQPQPPPKGDIATLLAEFGIQFPFTNIVWQAYNPHPELEMAEREIVFITAGNGSSEPVNASDIATSGLQEVVTVFGGEVKSAQRKGLTFTPLLRTGPLSGSLDKSQAMTFNPLGGQGLNPNRRHRPDADEHVLACRVAGRLTEDAENEINVIFLADLDMIGPVFFSIRREGMGGSGIEFDNVTFVLNCIDDLSGDRRFIDVRKHRPELRTLVQIEAKQEEFNRQALAAKQDAEEKASAVLDKAQKRLDDAVAAVRNNPDLDEQSKAIQIDAKQEAERKKFELAKAQVDDEKARALEAADTQKRQDQRSLRNRYKGLTLFIAPIPALLVGLFVFLRRRKRERQIVPSSRMAPAYVAPATSGGEA